MGEGKMWNPTTEKYENAADVMAAHGLVPLELAEKEGLALINGTQFISSITAEAVTRAEALAHTADIIAAVRLRNAPLWWARWRCDTVVVACWVAGVAWLPPGCAARLTPCHGATGDDGGTASTPGAVRGARSRCTWADRPDLGRGPPARPPALAGAPVGHLHELAALGAGRVRSA